MAKITRDEFWEVWIKALESGEYEQGMGSLVENGKYCCLGVACAEAQKLGVYQTDRAYKNKGYLPKGMQKLLGINEGGEFASYVSWRGETFPNLANMNDRGVSFKTIARIIRRERSRNNFEDA